MTKLINQIDLHSLGLATGDEPNFTPTADLDLLRVTGECDGWGVVDWSSLTKRRLRSGGI